MAKTCTISRFMTSSVRALTLLAALLLLPACATQKLAEPSSGARPAVSIFERKLTDIAADSERQFALMEAGQISQDDFERRILDLASRYDELIHDNPNHLDLLILYGKFLRRVYQNDKANVMFAHADRIDDNVAVVKQQLGNYLAEQGQYAEALAYYLRAAELEPAEAIYHFGIGELLATFRDEFAKEIVFTNEVLDRQILVAFKRAAELDPKNKDICFRLGEAYYDLHNPLWSEALAYWEGVAAKAGLTPFERDVVRLHRARVLCELGRRREALALLRDEVAPVLAATRTRLMGRIAADDAAEAARKEAAAQ